MLNFCFPPIVFRDPPLAWFLLTQNHYNQHLSPANRNRKSGKIIYFSWVIENSWLVHDELFPDSCKTSTGDGHLSDVGPVCGCGWPPWWKHSATFHKGPAWADCAREWLFLCVKLLVVETDGWNKFLPLKLYRGSCHENWRCVYLQASTIQLRDLWCLSQAVLADFVASRWPHWAWFEYLGITAEFRF